MLTDATDMEKNMVLDSNGETRRIGLRSSKEFRLSEPVLRREWENIFLMAQASWWMETGSWGCDRRTRNFQTSQGEKYIIHCRYIIWKIFIILYYLISSYLILYYTILYIILYYIYYIILYYILYYTIYIILYYIILSYIIFYSIILYYIILYHIILYCIILYYTVILYHFDIIFYYNII